MSKWSKFLKAEFCGPVIRINNSLEFIKLQRLAKTNKLEGWKQLCKYSYLEILHILYLNYRGKDWNKDTDNNKSFLVENSYRGGFTFATLNEYNEHRQSPDEWEIVPMTEILNELK